jgi:hypothetical protein
VAVLIGVDFTVTIPATPLGAHELIVLEVRKRMGFFRTFGEGIRREFGLRSGLPMHGQYRGAYRWGIMA